MTFHLNQNTDRISMGTVIRRLMAKWGLKEADLARNVKLPQTTVNRLLLQERSDPRISTVVPIAQYFDVKLGQLVGLEPIEDEVFKDAGTFIAPATPTHLPLIEWDTIMPWVNNDNEATSGGIRKWVCTDRRMGERAFALESMPFMSAAFPGESVVFVDPEAPVLDGGYVVVLLNGSAPTVRKVMQDGTDIYFKPFDEHLPVSLKQPEHNIVGVIVESRMSF